MAYSSRDGRSDGRRSSTSRRPPSGRRPSSRGGTASGRSSRSTRNARGASRGGSSRNQTRTRNLTGPDTGYTLHSHRVNYSRRGGSTRDRLGFVNGRFIVLLVIVVIVVIVLISGISSCVSGSRATQNENQQAEEQTESKPRVASGISDDLTRQFNTVLDRDDQMAQIAQNADQYDDDRLLTLALNEPEAVSFVANYLTADKSASSYTDKVTKGEVPQLYDWDTRWGYVTYGDGCIGVTGSAPTTVAMAYMGLTGRSDVTPATLAQGTSAAGSSTSQNSNNSNASNNANASSSNSNTSTTTSDSAESVIQLMSQAGLDATQYDSSSDTLVACLSSSSVAAVYVDEDGLQDNRSAHWALVVGMNQDGTLNVFDPTSSLVSTRTWDSSTIARASSTILYVTVSESTQTADSTTTDDETDTAYGSSDESNGTSTSSTNDSSGSSSTSTSTSNRNSTSSNGSSTSTSSNANNSNSSSSSSSSSSSGSSSSGDYVGL